MISSDRAATGEEILSRANLSQLAELRPEAQLLLCCARTSYDSGFVDEVLHLIQRGINWDYLLSAAGQHGVLALLHQGLSTYCADYVPPEVIEKLRVMCRANAQHNLHLTRSLLTLLTAFESRSVSAVPYKGPMLAAVAYGNLSLRQFCDLDILVRRQDVLEAMEVLKENGYKLELPPGQSTPIPKLLYSKKDFRFVSADQRVVVELHWRLAGKHFYFPYSLDQLWPRLETISFSGTPVLNIPPEDLLVILCAHGSKHLWGRLLWICDIAELIKSNPGLDWQRMMRHARKCGSQRMVLLGLYLAKTLLGSVLPREVVRAIRSDRAVEPLAEELLKGTFPTDAFTAEQLEHHSHALYPFYIRMRERRRDKAKLAFQYLKGYLSAAVTPNVTDREFVALPPSIAFLYYLLRPLRLVARAVLSEEKGTKRVLVSMSAALPFKRHLFRAMRPLHPPKAVFQHLKWEGPFTVPIDDRHSFQMQHHGYGVETELFWKGLINGNQDETIRLWTELCKNAYTIFDVGSNIGVFSLVAKALNPGARVVGFEPVTHLKEKFKANCDLNGFEIECHQLAISNTDGEQEIFIAPGHVMTASLQSNPSRTEKEQIKTVQLATFIESHEIERIDLMKIDVESYEPQVLEGMGPYLQAMRPAMIIEILNDEIGSEVESLIDSCHYLFFCLDEHIGAVRQDHLTLQGHSRHSRNFLLCDEGTAGALGLLQLA